MNAEKLQALVKQATVKVNNPYVGSSGNVVLDCWEEQLSIELLADLIVKACADEALFFWCDQSDKSEESAHFHILKQFGVVK
jgi:hypothetical protein